MGIENLLKALKSIGEKKHISEYKGQRMGVDSFCWLHKAVYAGDIALALDPDSKDYLYYLKAKVIRLIKCGIVPIMIFDGERMLMKGKEENAYVFINCRREFKRNMCYEDGMKLLELGDIEGAKKKLVGGIDINSKMVSEFTEILKEMNVEFIIAPYEADAQLAYLDKIGYIDVVCTEDSDLLVYGCRKVLFKLDIDGNGVEITFNDIFMKCTDYNFSYFTHSMFMECCILAVNSS